MRYYNDELYHFGIKGMKWGVRRYQNADGSLTNAGRARYADGAPTKETVKNAKAAYKSASKEYDKSFRSAYQYTDRHPIKSNFTKSGKEKSRRLWGDAYEKNQALDKAKTAYKNEKAAYKSHVKAEKEKAAKSAVKDYNRKYDEASQLSDAATAKWEEAKAARMAMGKNKVTRFFAAVKNTSPEAKAYSKAYDEASRMSDKADAKWAEAKEQYRKTGRNAAERIVNNYKYRNA